MKITKNNYFETIDKIGVRNLPKELQEGHSYVEQASENNTNWNIYNEGGSVKKVIDNHFQFIEEFISKNTARSGTKKANNEPTKEIRKPETRTTSHNVERFSDDVVAVRKFANIIGKRKTTQQLLNLYRNLQKSKQEKQIRKTSPLAHLVKKISEKLKKICDDLVKTKTKEVKIDIENKSFLNEIQQAVGAYAIYPSIKIIRQYINIQGTEPTQKRVRALITHIQNAVETKKITKSDPYASEVEKISKLLVDFANGKSKSISLKESELNGLHKACGCCDDLGRIFDTRGKALRRCRSKKYSDAGKGACSYNKGLGKIYDTKGKSVRKCKSRKYSDAGKGACSYNKGLSGVMTAEQVANLKFELLPFSGTFLNLFGKPEKNFTLMVHGEPGSGKSTFLMQFGKYLTRFGKVLYMTSEEFGSSTLTDKVNKYLNPLPQNFEFTGSVELLHQQGKDIGDYDFVIFDSITDLGINLEYFKMLKEENPKTAFIMVLQHTKDGLFKGGKEWEHEAQIAAEIQEGVIHVYKNRFGAKGDWNFFENRKMMLN